MGSYSSVTHKLHLCHTWVTAFVTRGLHLCQTHVAFCATSGYLCIAHRVDLNRTRSTLYPLRCIPHRIYLYHTRPMLYPPSVRFVSHKAYVVSPTGYIYVTQGQCCIPHWLVFFTQGLRCIPHRLDLCHTRPTLYPPSVIFVSHKAYVVSPIG
jgi:hypothetical protein